MIDLTPFLMPPPRPNLAPVGAGAQAISGLADFQAKQAQLAQENELLQQKQQLAEQDSAAKNALQALEVSGRNKYYDAQAETHRMAVDAAQKRQMNADRAKLGEAFRKAKTPEQRQLILQEYKRLGLEHREEASDLDAQAAGGATGAETGIPAPAEPTESTMQFYGGQNEPTDVGPNFALQQGIKKAVEGAPNTEPSKEEPFPWELLGMGEPKPAEAAQPAKPQGKGKHIIFDPKTGEEVLVYDEKLQKAQTEQEMQDALLPAGEGGLTPESQKASKVAAQMAAKIFDATGNREFAITQAQNWLKGEMGQFKDRYAGGGGGVGGGGTGLTKQQQQAEQNMNSETRQWYNSIKSGEQFTNLESSKRGSELGLKLLAGPSGTEQLAGMKQYLYDISGKVVTKGEMDQLLASSGGFTSIEMFADRWLAEGQMPEKFKRNLTALLQTKLAAADAGIKETAEKARGVINGLTGDPRQGAIIYGAFTGDFSEVAPKARPGKPRSGQGSKAPPATGAMSTEEKRKKLMGLIE